MAGQIWAAGTPLSSANLNKLISTLDGTVQLAIAACRFVPGASPSLSEVAGVASITRNGTGDYTLTLDSAFSATPAVIATPVASGGGDWTVIGHTVNTSSARVVIMKGGVADETGVDEVHVIMLGLVA